MSVRIVRAGREDVVEDETVLALLDAASTVIVDVGTGDARYAYETARAQPDALVIGFDPAPERMRDVARRSGRAPHKGGAPNLSLWRASIEAPPMVLWGRSDEVHVILPWGALLRGVVEADPAVISGLAALAHTDTAFRIVLNAGAWIDPPTDLVATAVPTPEQLTSVAVPAFAAVGITLDVVVLDASEAVTIPSTWTSRLAHAGRTPHFVELRTPPRVPRAAPSPPRPT